MRIYLFLLCLAVISCTSNYKEDNGTHPSDDKVNEYYKKKPYPPLAGTKWELRIAENCYTYLYFQNQRQYLEVNCENELYPNEYGIYSISNDTLTTINTSNSSDSATCDTEDNECQCGKSSERVKSKFVYNGTEMRRVELWHRPIEDSAWEKQVLNIGSSEEWEYALKQVPWK